MANEETTSPASGEEGKEVKPETPETPVEGEKDESDEHIDYKAELDRERKRTERLSSDLTRKNEKLAKVYERNEEISEEREEELLKRLEEKFDQRLQSATKSVNEQYARDLARQLAGGDGELAELTYLKYKNRIVPSENMRDDMEEAYFLATGKKFQYEAGEARRAAISKGEKGDGRGAGQKPKSEPRIELTPEELKLSRTFGISVEELKKSKLQQ